MHKFEISLAEVPEVRTCGGFADTSEALEWVQPRDTWQVLLPRHRGTARVNGREFDLEPYDTVVVPPRGRCEIRRSGEETYVYYYATFKPVESERDVMLLPVHCRLGEPEGAFWHQNFRRSLDLLQLSRTHAHAVVYALLWTLAESPGDAAPNPFVAEAERLIESRLGEQLRIRELAHEIGISQSQLSRLFQMERGTTPLQYLRDRRAQRAHSLLTGSTMPIKQIAGECGFSDVQAFNRFVHDRLGASPRAVRSGKGNVDVWRLKEFRGPD